MNNLSIIDWSKVRLSVELPKDDELSKLIMNYRQSVQDLRKYFEDLPYDIIRAERITDETASGN